MLQVASLSWGQVMTELPPRRHGRGRGAATLATIATPARALALASVAVLSLLALMALLGATSSAENLPPVAVISSPRSGAEYVVGQVVVFDGRSSWDDDLPNLTYSWNFTDSVVEGRDKLVVQRSFLAPGDYLVVLKVIDAQGWSSMASVRIIVRAQNLAPVAAIAAPVEGGRYLVDRTIQFDGSLSRDPEGGTLRYLWETNRTGDLIGDRERFSIKLPLGNYLVNLTVYDLAGLGSSATVNISVVSDLPPVLSEGAVAPAVGPEGLAGGFEFRVRYTDPDGKPPQEVLVKVGRRGVFTSYAMAKAAGEGSAYRAGVEYTARVALTVGAHQHVFTCRDEFYGCSTALASGPGVYLIEDLDLPTLGARLTVNWSELGTSTVLRSALPAAAPTGAVVISSVVRFELQLGQWSEAHVSLSYAPNVVIDPASIVLMRYDGTRGLWVPAPDQVLNATAYRIEAALVGSGGVHAVMGAVSEQHQNRPPDLRIAYDAKDAYAGRKVAFDASRSTDPDGGVLLFFWSFAASPGERAGTGWTAGARLDHVFEEPGIYEVVLKAVDGGNEHVLSSNVSVRKYQGEPPGPLDNPGVLFVMGVLLLMAVVLSVFNRLRVIKPKGYDAHFGTAYTDQREEDEYSALFRKLTEDELRGKQPGEGPVPEAEGEAGGEGGEDAVAGEMDMVDTDEAD